MSSSLIPRMFRVTRSPAHKDGSPNGRNWQQHRRSHRAYFCRSIGTYKDNPVQYNKWRRVTGFHMAPSRNTLRSWHVSHHQGYIQGSLHIAAAIRHVPGPDWGGRPGERNALQRGPGNSHGYHPGGSGPTWAHPSVEEGTAGYRWTPMSQTKLEEIYKQAYPNHIWNKYRLKRKDKKKSREEIFYQMKGFFLLRSIVGSVFL